ncbi:MAG: CheR family methyltransferase [Bryobacteraceae bacterium]
MDSPSANGVEQFRQFIQATFGIQHDESKLSLLRDALQDRKLATEISSDSEYLGLLRTSPAEQEAVVRRITISETYFFRVPEQFEALMRTALPDLFGPLGKRTIRVLCCGCSSGEEPYTIAMLANDRRQNLAGAEIQITAIDLNPAVLELAKRGRYTQWSLRATNEYFRHEYFERQGNSFQLRDEIRRAVRFRQHNLFESALPGAFDVIFFRNVLIYFSPETARRAIEHIESMLSPGGYLFLGAAETLRGLSTAFEITHTDGAFYYRHYGGERRPRKTERLVAEGNYPPLAEIEESVREADTEWFDSIQRSASRIQELAQRPSPIGLPVATLPAPRLPLSSNEMDAEGLTLAVVAQLNLGNAGVAERACGQLLEHSNMDASAHYLMALCCEHRGDIGGAIAHDEIAAYLDPTFSMPQLHKGMLACRNGDAENGRRSLEKSLELLRTEDSARILLLGGGFHRQSLIQMCKRELEKCEGRQA